MKPLKLTMTAFGPYKNTETVDFRELDKTNLFVISGNTGAGKTTIFDGIAFALYGSASGSDREDIKALRSDFADDNTHTAVELEFSLNGRVYRILRQLGHVKKGNKSKTGERYEFFEKIDDKEIPCVDRQIVSEINKKVEAIIGLTQDQFKQIVMLPQGEFRKLLTSDTENKEAILRRLFKTEHYKHLSELLKNKKNTVEQQYNQVRQTLDHYITTIYSVLPEREDSLLTNVLSAEHYHTQQIVAGLEVEADYYLRQIEIDEKAYDAAYRKHDEKQNAFHEAHALNERFDELDVKEKRLKQQKEQVPVFAAKEKQLEAAGRASTIEIYEKQVSDWQKEAAEKKRVLENAEAAKKHADTKLEQATSYYKEAENKKDVREETGKKLDRLTDYLPIVKDIDMQKGELDQLVREGKLTRADLEKIRKEIKTKKEAAEKCQIQIKQLEEAVNQYHDKKQQLLEMRERAKLLQGYIDLSKQKDELEKAVTLKKEHFSKAKEQYQRQEEAWIANQAIVLANHLHDGEACPVCGSIEHPNKATMEKDAFTKEQLETLKKDLDIKDDSYRNTLADLKAKLSQLQEKETEIKKCTIPLESVSSIFEQLVEEGKKLASDVTELDKKRKKLEEQKEIQENIAIEIKQLEPKRDQFEKVYQDLVTSYESKKAVYEERLRNIPDEVKVLTELEKQLKETREMKVKLEKEWEQAQSGLQKAKEEQTSVTANRTHAKTQLNETNKKRQLAENQFHEAMLNAGFESIEVYREAKMSPPDQQILKNEIDQFKQSLSTLTEQVADLKEVLKEKSRIDLTALKQQLDELKQAYELALSTWNRSKDSYQGAIDLKVHIMEAESHVKEHEKRLAAVSELYDVLRGQNDRKISFERYLQIEYLEQIIDAANMRLRELSNGQYYLTRSDRQESHGKQSGLALDVYDAYTGQTRDVKTLSGGEKFNASLALALGMSDVIQSFQGNISIDTMFIDEGFGSLDEESLTKAIDTLVALQQSGRMIGVISHVQELKSMFPAMLEVKKMKEGYSRTRFVMQ